MAIGTAALVVKAGHALAEKAVDGGVDFLKDKFKESLQSMIRVGQAVATRLLGDIVHALHAIFDQAIRTRYAGDSRNC